MTTIDLSSYNLSELKGLHHEIDNMIRERRQQDMRAAREKILAMAQELGISVDELIASSEKKLKKASDQKTQARYQNPNNIDQTWSGRGRQPKWIVEGLANGKTLESYRI